MNIRPSISAKKILKIQPIRKPIKSIIRAFLVFLEKYFGSEILLDMPEKFLNMPVNFIEIINRFSNQRSSIYVKNIRLPRFPDEPFIYQYRTKINGSFFGKGAHLFDEEKALWKSLNESIKKYLWNSSEDFYKKSLIFSSYQKIKNEALNIHSLAGFTQEQRNKNRELYFDDNTKFGWIKARDILSGKNIFCPVQLLSENYHNLNVKTESASQKLEPMLRWNEPTGLAIGKSLEEAITKGVLEIIRKDAFAICYLNKISPPVIDFEDLASQDADMMNILRTIRRYKLELRLTKLPTDFPAKVILAIILDNTGIGPALTVGISAGFDIKECILNSVSESLSARQFARRELGSSSKDEQAADIESLDKRSRLIFWSKIENRPQLDFLINGETVKIDLIRDRKLFPEKTGVPLRKYYEKKLAILKNKIKKGNFQAIFAELTTKEIRNKGLRCVKVVIPELQPLHLIEKNPYYGGKRLKEIPSKFGYKPAEEINKVPHPFV
ncbi:MAG TPA: YcaO-like family protein [Candidatus Moranbacteria bacterium]|nr:YcaO-like family protein [Candidatus Moranbacteria bacterium]